MKHDALPTPALALEPTPHGSDPPSGVRRRNAAAAPTAQGAGLDLLTFIAEHAPSAETVAYHFGVTVQEAEDIRQDTFEVMWTTAEPIQSPLAYFWTVAMRRKARLLSQKARATRHAPDLRAEAERRPSPFPSPDAGIEHQERARAVGEVLAHVKPSRRGVAELRLAGYEEGEVMAELRLPRGTVRSRWQRARKDGRSYWAALAGLLSAIWLWLGTRGRSTAGALTRGGRSVGPGPMGEGAWGRRVHLGAGAAIACIGLPLVALTHAALVAPGARFASSFEAIAASLTADARREGDATRDAERGGFAPFLTTNAEREREHEPIVLAQTEAPRVAPPPKAPVPQSQSRAELEMARSLLLRTITSYQEGHAVMAEGALQQYRRMFPDNPYPALYERAASAGHPR